MPFLLSENKTLMKNVLLVSSLENVIHLRPKSVCEMAVLVKKNKSRPKQTFIRPRGPWHQSHMWM